MVLEEIFWWLLKKTPFGEFFQLKFNYIFASRFEGSGTLYRGVEQLVARRAHNPKVVGSSPASATTITEALAKEINIKALKYNLQGFFYAHNKIVTEAGRQPSPVDTGVPALEYPFREFIPLLWKTLGLSQFIFCCINLA